MNYKKSYYILFNTITDCLEQLENTQKMLIKSQQETEQLYVESENKTVLELNNTNKDI